MFKAPQSTANTTENQVQWRMFPVLGGGDRRIRSSRLFLDIHREFKASPGSMRSIKNKEIKSKARKKPKAKVERRHKKRS